MISLGVDLGNKAAFSEELAAMYSKDKRRSQAQNEDRNQKGKDALMFWVFHLIMVMRFL